MITYIDGTTSECLPDTFERAVMVDEAVGLLILADYKFPFPPALRRLGGYVYLNKYAYPLPNTIKTIEGNVCVENYQFPLPKQLTRITGWLSLIGYDHPLPENLSIIDGAVHIRQYTQPLPPWIISAGEFDKGEWLVALYQNGQWRIRLGVLDLSLDEALVRWKHSHDEWHDAMQRLAVKIKQSPLQ